MSTLTEAGAPEGVEPPDLRQRTHGRDPTLVLYRTPDRTEVGYPPRRGGSSIISELSPSGD